MIAKYLLALLTSGMLLTTLSLAQVGGPNNYSLQESTLTFEACVDGSELLKVQDGQLTLAHRNYNGIGSHVNCDSSWWDVIKIDGVPHKVSLNKVESGASYSIDGAPSLGVKIEDLKSFEYEGRGSVEWAGPNQILINDDPFDSGAVYTIKLHGSSSANKVQAGHIIEPRPNEEQIFGQYSLAGVSNNPPNPTVFTIDQERTITKLVTYHWNNGQGQAPGTIGLQDQNGKTWGPWQANAVRKVYWEVDLNPYVDLPAGTYKVVDSDPSTWSYNSETGNSGIAEIVALKVGSEETGTVAPCSADAEDLSPRSPTDPYFAGPGLDPGVYRIWCGKRTGTNIGLPDKWNAYGPVTLVGGTFYVFNVETGNIGPANPQLINPTQPNPTPGESVVWYKLSAQYPYVVCFEGPLTGTGTSNGSTEGIKLAGS